MQKKSFDIIVVGSGLAGLTAAYHASKNGSVALITKSQLDTSNSYYAQGGIAGAISEDDSPEFHAHDTLVAGRGLCEKDSVNILVEEGKDRILELIEMGMQFDSRNGEIVLGLEGGHSKRRILHAGGDATGRELTRFMHGKVVEQKAIEIFEYTAVTKLIVTEGTCLGVQAIDFISGQNLIFESAACILATGGLSRIFSRTTNPHTATGDGISLAYEAGARVEDMEFIQFHPSALCIENQDAFLISEAVRGEGAWLLNKNGERFMKDIHPLAELAPRDVVAFSIYQQMKKDQAKNVFLSLRHLDPDKIKKRFSNIHQKLQSLGFDMTSDLLPIAPAAHYMVGGVKTGLHGETNIKGLFACGEVASTGVMGANRLASNSLLECLVYGKRASEMAAKAVKSSLEIPEPEIFSNDPKFENFYLEIKNEVADLMSGKVGIVRAQSELEDALNRLEEIRGKIAIQPHDYNILKALQIVEICELIVRSALLRKESRGGHIREEYKQENPDFRVHIAFLKNHDYELIPIRK